MFEAAETSNASSTTFEGHLFNIKAERWDGTTHIRMPGAIVIAPDVFIGNYSGGKPFPRKQFEFQFIVPPGTTDVRLDYR